MNPLTDFLRSLRAVREFQRQPVPDDVVRDILEVARWSGSASNRQFGAIIVVSARETLHALAGLGGYVGHLRDAALAMLLVMPGEWPEGETFDEGRRAGQAGGPHGDRPGLSGEPAAARHAQADQRTRPRGALPGFLRPAGRLTDN